MFAVVDANNFYVSCERVFNPKLEKRPVVVLSNNDGCIVARSNEVKKLGVPMGAPIFQWRKLLEANNTVILSCNFALYGDMSNRMMKVLSGFSDKFEIYSIDEAFLDVSEIKRDYLEYGNEIKKMIKKWTGLPVSVGIGATKTLAKAANEIAKHDEKYRGVFSLTTLQSNLESSMKLIPISDVWGVGRSYTKSLLSMGVKTAFDLTQFDELCLRKKFGISLVRTTRELKGQKCVDLDHHSDRKTIITSRSFSNAVSDILILKQAVASFVSNACETLREEKLLAGYISVYVSSGYFESNGYFNSFGTRIAISTDNTAELIKYAFRILEKIYKKEYKYKKAGIMLTDLSSNKIRQQDLWGEIDNQQSSLSKAVDKINLEWGSGTIDSAAMGIKQAWQGKSQNRSPRYTTKWEELVMVR